jgi:hypothetical protein
MAKRPSKQSAPVQKEGWGRRLLSIPFRVVSWLFGSLIFLVVIVALIAVPLGLLFVVSVIFIDVFVGLFDLIFRLHVRDSIYQWAENIYDTTIKPFGLSIWTFILSLSANLGITAVLDALTQTAKRVGTEIVRAIVLFLLFVLVGFSVYHLRVVRRVTYGIMELAVAIVAMWIAIDAMAGGVFSLPFIVALLSGLYIMVRGLQNIDDGLRALAEDEAKRKIKDGPAKAWVNLWRALFYDLFEARSFEQRFEVIKESLQRIQQDRKALLPAKPKPLPKKT